MLGMPILPGYTIVELLEEKGMAPRSIMDSMGMSGCEFASLLWGMTEITEEIARKLESTLGPPVSFWLNLEMNYREELKQTEQK